MSIRDEGKANKVSNTERKYTMKSNLLKKIAGWVIMVFFGMTILTGCDDYNFLIYRSLRFCS